MGATLNFEPRTRRDRDYGRVQQATDVASGIIGGSVYNRRRPNEGERPSAMFLWGHIDRELSSVDSLRDMLDRAFPGLAEGSEPNTEQQLLTSVRQMVNNELSGLLSEVRIVRTIRDTIARGYDEIYAELKQARSEYELSAREWNNIIAGERARYNELFGVLLAIDSIVRGAPGTVLDADEMPPMNTLPERLAEKMGLTWPVVETTVSEPSAAPAPAADEAAGG